MEGPRKNGVPVHDVGPAHEAAPMDDAAARNNAAPPTAAGLEGAAADGVSSLELFFDLVFVFTLTQLTSLLVADPNAVGLGRAALVFVVLYWMYGGYAWLTDQATPLDAIRRLLLFAGMAGFFVCALAIPSAFSGSGVAFGLGYLAVVAVHGGLYAERFGRAVLRFTPFNLLGAVLVTAAAEIDGPSRYVLWLSPIVLQYLASALTRRVDDEQRPGFDIRARHFAERHAGLVIIAFGESTAAVGIAMRELPVDPRTVAVAGLGFVLSVALWWCYFGGDDARSVEALARASLNERVRMALNAYFYAYIPLLLGVIVLAAGIRLSVGGLDARLGTPAALMLSTGVAAYLLGTVSFRAALGLAPLALRAAGVVLVLPVAAVGVYVDGLAEIAALVAIVLGVLVVEAHRDRLTTRREVDEREDRSSELTTAEAGRRG